MLTGTMYFIGYRLSLLCSVPVQAANFRQEVPGTAVVVHVAVDPGHATSVGALVHIPLQGCVVGLPVVCQPDDVSGGQSAVIQIIGKPSWCWRIPPPSTLPVPWRCRRFGQSGCRQLCPKRRWPAPPNRSKRENQTAFPRCISNRRWLPGRRRPRCQRRNTSRHRCARPWRRRSTLQISGPSWRIPDYTRPGESPRKFRRFSLRQSR